MLSQWFRTKTRFDTEAKDNSEMARAEAHSLKHTVYLSVGVFSTIVLIVDTLNKETNITNGTEFTIKPLGHACLLHLVVKY